MCLIRPALPEDATARAALAERTFRARFPANDRTEDILDVWEHYRRTRVVHQKCKFRDVDKRLLVLGEEPSRHIVTSPMLPMCALASTLVGCA